MTFLWGFSPLGRGPGEGGGAHIWAPMASFLRAQRQNDTYRQTPMGKRTFSARGLQDDSKTAQERSKRLQDRPRLFQDGLRWPQDGPRWPRDGPRGPQEDPREGLRRPNILFFIWFLHVFRVLGFSGQERPKTAQEVPNIVPRRPKRPPRRLQDGPRGPQESPKRASRGA